MAVTVEQMLKAAHEAGYLKASTRLITDWTQLGLLGPAQRKGQGQGKGVQFFRPDCQTQLFLDLLDHHQKGTARPTLCLIPVSHWLIYEDDCIEIEQLRKAFKTWWTRTARITVEQNSKLSKQIVDETLPDLSLESREGLEKSISGSLTRKSLDTKEIADLANNQWIVQFGRQLSVGERNQLAFRLDVAWSMVKAMTQIDSVSEAVFVLARKYAKSEIVGECEQFRSRSQTTVISRQEFPTYEKFVGQSFQLILKHVGMQINAEEKGSLADVVEDLPPLNEIEIFKDLPIT